MNINELAKEIHQIAVDHGWWEVKKPFGDVIALCHSELSEAFEEYRNGKPMLYVEDKESGLGISTNMVDIERPNFKTEGIATEMADCIIRILDWCASEDIDIEKIINIKNEYNKTRSYKHGGKIT